MSTARKGRFKIKPGFQVRFIKISRGNGQWIDKLKYAIQWILKGVQSKEEEWELHDLIVFICFFFWLCMCIDRAVTWQNFELRLGFIPGRKVLDFSTTMLHLNHSLRSQKIWGYQCTDLRGNQSSPSVTQIAQNFH